MPTSSALLASAFIASLGVNTHLDYTQGPYANTSIAESSINYLGVKNIRDSAHGPYSIPIWSRVARNTGVKFINYMNRSSPADMQQTLALTPQLANLGLLNYVEGANEPDAPDAMALGNSLDYARTFQQQVFAMGRSLNLPVINLSVGVGWTAADGWQGNYDSIGDLSAIADFANAHTYPAVAKNLPYKTVDRLNYLASLGAPGKPVIISEMGWNTAVHGQSVVATNVLNGIMDSAFLKNEKTYLFALFDDASGKWGLMNGDGTPRVAGQAVRNLTTLLGDTGPTTYNPGTFTYDFAGLKGTERSVLFGKTDGSYWVSVWDETNPGHVVTLNLQMAAQEIQVFDPMVSTEPTQTVANSPTVTATLGSTPLLFKVVPAPLTNIAFYAANGTINADSTTKTITVYGTGNTVNGNTAAYTLTAATGGNTFNAGSGQSTLNISGVANTINIGSANTWINDTGSSNTIKLATAGSGVAVITGSIFSQGTKLNLSTLMASTTWNGDRTKLGNYLKIWISGTTGVVLVTPSGVSTGAAYVAAKLNSYSALTFTQLIDNSTF